MSNLKGTWQQYEATSCGVARHNIFMVVCPVGNEYCRTFFDRSGIEEISPCSSRLFHKVDRGRAASHNNCSTSPKICVENNLSVRVASNDHNRQRAIVYR